MIYINRLLFTVELLLTRSKMRVLIAFLLTLSAAKGFVPLSAAVRHSSSQLEMAPKYDKQAAKWIPTSPEEGPEAGYDIMQTFLMHGPKPAFNRVFTPDDYEQAVLKFMAGDKVSRIEAQGNMDAYLRNPQDWAVSRMEEEKTGKKIDYWTLRQKTVVLVTVWSGIVAFFGYRAVAAIFLGESFYAFGPFTGAH